MIHASKVVAVLDANVLYPAPLRDFLLRLADVGLYHPKWTDEIQEEWIRNLLLNRPDLTKSKLNKTQEAMDSAFPDANVSGYKSLIPALSLPDKDDRHVLAAAIKAKANTIITFNTKDFPTRLIKPYHIEVQTPDELIPDLWALDKSKVLQAFNNQVNSLRNPPQSKSTILTTLGNCGLSKSVSLLRAIID